MAHSAGQGPLGDVVKLGTIGVIAPESRLGTATNFPLELLKGSLGDGVELIGGGYTKRISARRGILLDLYWKASRHVPDGHLLNMRLLDKEGKTWAEDTSPLFPAGPYPLEWKTGEILRGQYSLSLAPQVPPGSYRLTLKLLPLTRTPGFEGREHVVGSVEVVARERLFLLPSQGRPLHALFDKGISLAGYRFSRRGPSGTEGFIFNPGDTAEIALWWQLQPTVGQVQDTSYSVFVHLLDAQGRLVAQHDGLPQGGEAPTTTWLPGEVILDVHPLALPDSLSAGEYTLVVGMYDTIDMKRLPTADGRDHLVVGKIVVE